MDSNRPICRQGSLPERPLSQPRALSCTPWNWSHPNSGRASSPRGPRSCHKDTHLHALLVLQLQRAWGRGGQVQPGPALHPLRDEVVQGPQGGQDSGVLPQIVHGHVSLEEDRGGSRRSLPHGCSPASCPRSPLPYHSLHNTPGPIITFFGTNWEPRLLTYQRRNKRHKKPACHRAAVRVGACPPPGWTDRPQEKGLSRRAARLPLTPTPKAQLLGTLAIRMTMATAMLTFK